MYLKQQNINIREILMKAIEKKRKGKQKYFNQTHFVYDKLAKNEGHSNHLISSVALSVLYSKISPRG